MKKLLSTCVLAISIVSGVSANNVSINSPPCGGDNMGTCASGLKCTSLGKSPDGIPNYGCFAQCGTVNNNFGWCATPGKTCQKTAGTWSCK